MNSWITRLEQERRDAIKSIKSIKVQQANAQKIFKDEDNYLYLELINQLQESMLLQEQKYIVLVDSEMKKVECLIDHYLL